MDRRRTGARLRGVPVRPGRALQVHGRPGALEHLTRRRIELAARQPRGGGETLAALAGTVGYGSESAPGVAFKRVTGARPGAYRRRPSPS
ncbi:helix-turn-helix domain-containing protein [Streptomyces sp. NPDC002463]|uniref:helix-turn-helix domain-containing protein n=1 Tax=Streptomyces sp. NPDC002463 TaxID=3364645 RepID=UPI00369FB0FA